MTVPRQDLNQSQRGPTTSAELSPCQLPRPVRARSRADIARLHVNDARRLLLYVAVTGTLAAVMALAAWTWALGYWPGTLLCWLVAAHLAHNKGLEFHEAAHRTLHVKPFVNEGFGIVFGTIALIPLSVFRFAHAGHHLHLARPDDPELWPFVNPRIGRGARLLAVLVELGMAFVYGPVLYLRAVVVGQRRISRAEGKRMLGGYALCVATWGATLGAVHALGWWQPFVVGYLVPLFLAANLQALRKYVEHVGLFGDTILTATRTVAATGLVGHTFSGSLFHILHHGTHHRYAKVPCYNLPAATPYVYGQGEPTVPVYSSYLHATLDMLRTLGNPRVGRQWLEPGTAPTREAELSGPPK
jgi:fatty acid desaturase